MPRSRRVLTVPEREADQAALSIDPKDVEANLLHSQAGKPDEQDPDLANALAAWHGQERQKVFLWLIPRNDGYELRVEVANAADPEEARRIALEYQVPAGNGFRHLEAMEENWVKTNEPFVVRDTTSVSLSHDGALDDNERLMGRDAAFRSMRYKYAELGIDAFEPEKWLAKVNSDTAEQLQAAAEAEANRKRQLVHVLVSVQEQIASIASLTGFAPAPAYVAPEPDVTDLTIYAPARLNKQDYPRLADANWTTTKPQSAITAAENNAFRLLLKDGGILWQAIHGLAGDEERLGMQKIEQRIRTMVQLTPLAE